MERDQEKFDREIKRIRPRLMYLAGKIVGPESKEDVVQDAVLKAWTHFDQFQGRSAFTTWLYRITANTALMHLRKNKAFTQKFSEMGDEWPESPSKDEGALKILLNDERAEIGYAALKMLKPNFREVILLSCDEELADKEIAAALGIAVTAVKSRLHRARAQLPGLVEKELRIMKRAKTVRRSQVASVLSPEPIRSPSLITPSDPKLAVHAPKVLPELGPLVCLQEEKTQSDDMPTKRRPKEPMAAEAKIRKKREPKKIAIAFVAARPPVTFTAADTARALAQLSEDQFEIVAFQRRGVPVDKIANVMQMTWQEVMEELGNARTRLTGTGLSGGEVDTLLAPQRTPYQPPSAPLKTFSRPKHYLGAAALR